MPDFLVWGAGGALVGLFIGLTGVGGGSLMTPFLVYFGMPLPTAIGTDLMYATITKCGGVHSHHRHNNIHWDIVFLLAAGSLPCSVLTALVLKNYISINSEVYESVLATSLGVMLIITAALLIFRNPLIQLAQNNQRKAQVSLPRNTQGTAYITVLVGAAVGVFVTLSSIGAGVLGTSALLFLYPRMVSVHVIGTELTHAIPLTMVAGISYWLVLDSVDFTVLPALLVGSLPGVYLGVRLVTKVPQHILRILLILMLGTMGVRFVFFH